MITEAKPQDAAIISDIAMRSKAHWGYDDQFMSQVRDELTYSAENVTQHPTFIATKKANIIGFYQLQAVDAGEVELEALFVEPTFMGSGVGARLFCHAVEKAGALGFKTLSIQSDPAAEGFYTKQGCVKVGTKASLSIAGRQLPLLEFSLE
jgi:N-acetylglutamate synthase-like GNAT family acetyltransferase